MKNVFDFLQFKFIARHYCDCSGPQTMILPVQGISDDILYKIFDLLDDEDIATDLTNLSTVCQSWHSIAQEVLDRSLSLTLAVVFEERNLNLFRRIHNDPLFRSRIHRLVIKDWHHDALEVVDGNWPWLDGGYFSTTYKFPEATWQSTVGQVNALANCMTLLTLSSFSWNAIPPLPGIIINAMDDQHYSDILIEDKHAIDNVAWSYTPISNELALAGLHALANLVSLDLLVAATDDRGLESLGALIASRPRIRRIGVTAVGRLWPGATEAFHSPSKFEAERELCIARSISWLSEPLRRARRILNLDELELDNFCVCRSQYYSLSDLIQLDQLRALKVSCFSLLSDMHSGLPCLQSLGLSFRNGRMSDPSKCLTDWPSESVAPFVAKCHNLKHLELVDRPDILKMALSNNSGTALESVKVHTTLSLAPIQVRANLPCSLGSSPGSNDFVLRLGCLLPDLTSLAIYRHCEPYIVSGEEYDFSGFTIHRFKEMWNTLRGSTDPKLTEFMLRLQRSVQPDQYNRLERQLNRQNGGHRSYVAHVVDHSGRFEAEVAMEELLAVREAIRKGAPSANTYLFTWKKKYRELDELDREGLCCHARRTNGRLVMYRP